jgi:hypothetical protein
MHLCPDEIVVIVNALQSSPSHWVKWCQMWLGQLRELRSPSNVAVTNAIEPDKLEVERLRAEASIRHNDRYAPTDTDPPVFVEEAARPRGTSDNRE